MTNVYKKFHDGCTPTLSNRKQKVRCIHFPDSGTCSELPHPFQQQLLFFFTSNIPILITSLSHLPVYSTTCVPFLNGTSIRIDGYVKHELGS